MADAGIDVGQLNQGRIDGQQTFVRTVFELGSERMRWGGEGLELEFDVGIPGPLDYRYRSEMRETQIDVPIPAGTTQAYCMRFTVEELPDLHGPVEIFQRFNRDIDGPDIGVELTGANQFSNAVPNDIQVVAFDGRHRMGVQLDRVNTLMVVVYNHGTNGAYKVVLNGQTLRQAGGLDTIGSPAGGWGQFGLYPHGLYEGENRRDQIDSGRTMVRFEYADFTLANLDRGSADLGGFTVN